MILLFLENSQIHAASQITTSFKGRSFRRSSNGATDVINAFKAYFNGPTATKPSENQ